MKCSAMIAGLTAVFATTPAAMSEGSTPQAPLNEPCHCTAPRDPQRNLIAPLWEAIPSGDDLGKYYPSRTERYAQPGGALIGCTAGPDLWLTQCALLADQPPQWRFGEAALKPSRFIRMKPTNKQGRRVKGCWVRVPIRFEVATDDAATAAPIKPQ